MFLNEIEVEIVRNPESKLTTNNDRSSIQQLERALLLERCTHQNSIEYTAMHKLHDHYILRLMEHREFLAEFQKHAGCSPIKFLKCLALLHTWYKQLTPTWVRAGGGASWDHRYIFGKARIPAATATLVLDRLALRADTILQGAPAPVLRAEVDTGPLMKSPLYLDGQGELICLDFEYLEQAFSRGVHSLMMTSSDRELRQRYLDAKGEWFEEFCSNELAQLAAIRGSNWLPRGVEHSFNSDGILVEDSTAIIVELKSGYISTHTKLGGDIRAIEKDLRTKFVMGEGAPKGIEQLAVAAEKLARAKGFGSNLGAIKPLLVVEDPFVAKAPIRNYLRDRAHVRMRSIPKIRPLEVITYEELIMLVERSHCASPVSILKNCETNIRYISNRNVMIAEYPIGLGRFDPGSAGSTTATDVAFLELLADFQDHSPPLCSQCKGTLANWQRGTSPAVWLCLKCNIVERELTQAEIEKMDADLQTAVNWFTSSRAQGGFTPDAKPLK